MKRLDAIEHIVNSKGRILVLEFVKRSDGSLRRMRCRFDQTKSSNPEELIRKARQGLLLVWDVDKKGARAIPVEGLQQLRIKGKWEKITDEE